MNTINPFIILSPTIALLIAIVPIVIFKPNIRIIIFSAIAYFIAILLKYVIQSLLANFIISSPIYLQALFYGSLTAIFEVGLAFLIALSFKDYTKRKALSYGSMLAFWENGIVLGIIGLISVASLLVLQNYNATLTQQIIQSQPILAYSTPQLLPYIGFGALERVSSFLAHSSWGSLAYYYSFTRSNKLLLIALLGYVDALVPIMNYGIIPSYLGEVIIFALSLIAFIISYKKLP